MALRGLPRPGAIRCKADIELTLIQGVAPNRRRHQGGARRCAGEGGLDLRSGHFLDTAISVIHRHVAERACEAQPQGFANFGIGKRGCRA